MGDRRGRDWGHWLGAGDKGSVVGDGVMGEGAKGHGLGTGDMTRGTVGVAATAPHGPPQPHRDPRPHSHPHGSSRPLRDPSGTPPSPTQTLSDPTETPQTPHAPSPDPIRTPQIHTAQPRPYRNPPGPTRTPPGPRPPLTARLPPWQPQVGGERGHRQRIRLRVRPPRIAPRQVSAHGTGGHQGTAPEPELSCAGTGSHLGRGGGEATGSKRSSDLWGLEVLNSHPRSRIIEWERAERRSACSAPPSVRSSRGVYRGRGWGRWGGETLGGSGDTEDHGDNGDNRNNGNFGDGEDNRGFGVNWDNGEFRDNGDNRDSVDFIGAVGTSELIEDHRGQWGQ